MSSGLVSVWILGDQLLENHPALAAVEEGACLVLVESYQRATRLLYQRKKLVLLFSAMRHYAQHLRSRGYCVDYRQAQTFSEALRDHIRTYQPGRLVTMAASSYTGRRFQENLSAQTRLPVQILTNTQFLSGQFDPLPQAGKRMVMEHFYRRMRRHFNILMGSGNQPVGGAWNYDAQNRQSLPRGLRAPPVIPFAPDSLTRQVMDEVERLPGTGSVQDFQLAVTHEQARFALDDFLTNRLSHFGAYQDAMSRDDNTLFHSYLSPYLNLGLLTPLQVARAAEAAYRDDHAPLNSVEGFIRQVIGWREYMYSQYWRQMPGLLEANFWQAHRLLPGWFWTAETQMACLRRAPAHEIADIQVIRRPTRRVGTQNAARIKAAVELGLRLTLNTEEDRPTIHSPADAAAMLQHEMSALEQEHLRVILLDTRNRVIDIVEIYHGSLNSAQVRVAELFKPAIQRMAAAIILIHNHPSGDPSPSPDDVAVTRAVVQAGKLLDIDTLDHLVIGRGRFVSLKERGLGFDGRVSETKPGYRLRRSTRYSIQDDDDLIYAYTRSQALEDGVLVDVSQMASEASFHYPTAITADLHARITPNEREKALGQSYEGRLWDVVFLASSAARQAGTQDRCSFEVRLFEADETPPHRTHRRTLSLWMVVGPGDQGEPVITIGFPEDF